LDKSDDGYERIVVPLFFAVIFFVSVFCFRLGNAVIKELREPDSK